MKTVEQLLDEAANLGTDRIIFPIDILAMANELADHPDRRAAIPGLTALLHHQWHFQRQVALRALWRIGGDALGPTVVSSATSMVTSDDAPSVRAEAIRLLAVSARDQPLVRVALSQTAASDDTTYVRAAAAEVLSRPTVSGQ